MPAHRCAIDKLIAKAHMLELFEEIMMCQEFAKFKLVQDCLGSGFEQARLAHSAITKAASKVKCHLDAKTRFASRQGPKSQKAAAAAKQVA